MVEMQGGKVIMSESSFRVKKDIIMAACNAAIAHVDAKRKALFDAAVFEWTCPKWYRKALSQEVAERFVEASSSSFATWRILSGSTRYQAEELLAACSVSEGDIISLGTEEAAFVAEWSKTG